jgi:hypothetical protein
MRIGAEKANEGLDWETLMAGFAEMRDSSTSLGDVPLVVLTHGKKLPPRPDIAAEVEAQIAQQRAELPKLSSNGVQVIGRKSGHYVQLDQPELVVASVRAVVESVRTHSRLDATQITSANNP